MMTALLLLAMFGGTEIAAQPSLFVGTEGSGGGPATPSRTEMVLIDLTRPASGSGYLTKARIPISSGSCSRPVDVVVYRRSGPVLSRIARRGPFDLRSGAEVSLFPAIPIEEGDLIGVHLGGAASSGCDSPLSVEMDQGRFVLEEGDPGQIVIGTSRYNEALRVSATGTATLSTVAVIPVVGNGGGIGGAHWTTSARVMTIGPGDPPIAALRWRPEQSADPVPEGQIAMELERDQVRLIPDFGDLFGTGPVGSIEVRVPPGSDLLESTEWLVEITDVRSGASQSIPVVPIDQFGARGDLVLGSGDRGYLFRRDRDELTAPSGSTRRNIGIRALARGASVDFRPAPDYYPWSRVRLEPNELRQFPAESLVEVADREVLEVQVTFGSAIVYESVVDEGTNGASIQFVHASRNNFGEPLPPRCTP